MYRHKLIIAMVNKTKSMPYFNKYILQHVILHTCMHYKIDKKHYFYTEDGSTPVHVALRCPDPAYVRYHTQRAHYMYNYMHKCEYLRF